MAKGFDRQFGPLVSTVDYFDHTYEGSGIYDLFRNEEPVFPGGDVAPNIGVCSDLIVRALRAGGYDLQQLIHDDIIKEQADSNI